MITRTWIKCLVFLLIILMTCVSSDSNAKQTKTLVLSFVKHPSRDWLAIHTIFRRASVKNCKDFDAYRFIDVYFVECPTGWFVARAREIPSGPFYNLRNAVGLIEKEPFALKID